MLDKRTTVMRKFYFSFDASPVDTIWCKASYADPVKLAAIIGEKAKLRAVSSTTRPQRENDDEYAMPVDYAKESTHAVAATIHRENMKPNDQRRLDENPELVVNLIVDREKGWKYSSRNQRHSLQWFEHYMALVHTCDEFNVKSHNTKMYNGNHLGFLKLNEPR